MAWVNTRPSRVNNIVTELRDKAAKAGWNVYHVTRIYPGPVGARVSNNADF
jgi:hypothetical protein